MNYKNWKTFWCDRRNKIQHKSMIALFLYTLTWGVSFAYALTETKADNDGWTVGNILILCGIVSGVFTGLIGYIFTMTVRGLRSDQRRDREAAKETNDKLDNTLNIIFTELKEKQAISECHRNMDKLEYLRRDGI